jgi:hypothetical protein
MRFICLALVIGIVGSLLGCANGAREGNDAAVAKFRKLFLDERYGEIYRNSSEVTRASMTSDEFVNKMSAMAMMLSDLDKKANWRRDERGSPEESVYRDDNWSSLIVEGNGRQVNVTLWWGQSFELCGIEMSGDIPNGGIRLFRTCD